MTKQGNVWTKAELREEPESSEAVALIRDVSALFVDRHPAVVGAAISDLIATWLYGHIIPGDRKATKRLRQQVMVETLKAAERLIAVRESADEQLRPQ